MKRKALTIAAWVVGGLVALPIVAYVAAVLVNLHDEEPSADAARLTALYAERPPVDDADNAFIYLLGFNAPLDESPRDVGSRRLAWLQRGKLPIDADAEPAGAPLDSLIIDPEIARFRALCDTPSLACVSAFDDAARMLERWYATHPWLLERYGQLIAHRAWGEFIPADISVPPPPSYTGVMDGQRLFLLQLKTLADAGDAERVAELLASDQRFWRTVLASSDLLVTKMIATAALQRHFQWGSVVVRSLPAEQALAATPAEWRAPLTAAELSLRRTLVGEWTYFSGTMRKLPGTFADDAGTQLLVPLFQRQATLNRYSAYFTELDATLDAPLLGYAAAADAASSLAKRTASELFPPRSLYNVTGAVLMAAGPADYGPYARRVADIEGMRRAALATVTLRAENTPTAALAQALAASTLRNPYDEQPLRWDENAQAIVFDGLAPRDRGEVRFYY